jgi:fatty acid desaturase
MPILDVLSKDELKALTRTSNACAAWVTFVNFALIAGAFALAASWRHPLAWACASVILGGRALGLGVLTHDTAHLAFFSSRKTNEWAGTWLFGGLPHVPYLAYRKGHLEHHRTAGTGQDPDLAFVDGYPATRASLCRKLLRDISGINGLKNIAYQIRSATPGGSLPFLLSHGLLVSILFALDIAPTYACWWLGQLFVFPLVLRLRVMGEHGAVPDHMDRDPRRNTATTLAGPLGKLLVGPNNVHFHVEHHLAAAVPSYRLPAMHRLLNARGYFEGSQCVASSYWAVIRRCMAAHPGGVAKSGRQKGLGILNNMQ